MMKEPLYMYCWKKRAAATYLVYSEEEKDRTQQEMREDGTSDQYIWYEIKRIDG
jgi:hypothetical protein